MTDDRLNIMARLFGAGLAVFILILALTAYAFGQHSHTDDSLQRFRLVRITAPAKITYVEPNEKGSKLEYVSTDRNEIENGSFQITKDTAGDAIKAKEIYWLIYCIEDRHLYGAYKLTPEQKKGRN